MARNKKSLYNLYLTYFLIFSIVFGTTLLMIFFPVYLSDQGITLTNIGIIYGLSAIAAALVRFPLGYAADKYSIKSLLFIGSLVYPLFALGIFLAKTPGDYVVLKVFVEVFAAVFWVAFSAHLYSILARGKEGMGLAGSNAFSMFASGSAPLVAGFIIDSYGFNVVFYIGAIISAIGIPITLLLKNGRKATFDNGKMTENYKRLLSKKKSSILLQLEYL